MIRANILDPVTDIVLETCFGADDEGYCPRQDARGRIPCAGQVLEAQAPEVGFYLRIPVADHATKCPIRCFSVPSP